MPRRPRVAVAGLCYHVLNRGVGRMTLFDKPGDYAAFETALGHAFAAVPMRVVTYVLMPNHWHLVLWPEHDDHLSEFMRLLTVTHTQRWHAHRRTSGTGPVYQGRFKSFPIEQDHHLLTVARYVDRNPVRAGLCGRAQDWPWSAARGLRAVDVLTDTASVQTGRTIPPRPWLLSAPDWPVARPTDWADWVDRPQTAAEEEAVRRCLRRGRPFGGESWTARTAGRLGLESTMRPRGRPRVRGDA